MLRAAFIAQTQGPPPSGLSGGKRALDAVKLGPLTELSAGRLEIVIGVIDVVTDHPDLPIGPIREAPGKSDGACARTDGAACRHGTFVAGILSAKRGSSAPAICPDCTLLVRPIFSETASANGDVPSAKPEELAEAIVDCIEAGARVLNISAASGAAPSVTGAVALLWSEFPSAGAVAIKLAVTQAPFGRRTAVVPPLLGTWEAHRSLLRTHTTRGSP